MTQGAERTAIVLNSATSAVLCERCVVADKPLARLKGLLGRESLAPGDGLLLRPTGAIHTCFMRFPIDAVFLDRDLRILHIVPILRPWRGAISRRARAVLELRSGECESRQVEVGDKLVLLRDS